MRHRIWLRRAYQRPSKVDGHRVLVDRVWPRGVARDDLRLDGWARDLAPTDGLRRWFGHDPDRWEGFQARYRDELAERSGPAAEQFDELVERVARGRVTLVFGARDAERNNAVVLRQVLEEETPAP